MNPQQQFALSIVVAVAVGFAGFVGFVGFVTCAAADDIAGWHTRLLL